MTHSSDTSMKLPAYSLPSVTPICPPSPLSGETGNLVNALIVPAGCELIVQNPAPSQGSSTLKLVKDVVVKIGMESPHLSALPLNVIGTGNSSRDPIFVAFDSPFRLLCLTHHQDQISFGNGRNH